MQSKDEIDLEAGDIQVKDKDKEKEEKEKEEKERVQSIIYEEMCSKCCAATFTTMILSPFVICDLYFAATDNSCSYQIIESKSKISIDMHVYLLTSGIIGVISISLINCKIFTINVEDGKQKNSLITDDDCETNFCIQFVCWVFKLFTISWLIIGCVLFWGCMDLSKCSNPIFNYLFARFIILLVGSAISLKNN